MLLFFDDGVGVSDGVVDGADALLVGDGGGGDGDGGDGCCWCYPPLTLKKHNVNKC